MLENVGDLAGGRAVVVAVEATNAAGVGRREEPLIGLETSWIALTEDKSWLNFEPFTFGLGMNGFVLFSLL